MHQNFIKMKLGGKIKKFREGKGLSQTQLADMVDSSQGNISSLESDKTIPSSFLLSRIAKALDLDIKELLSEGSVIQNNYDHAIGNVNSQVTINNQFPENMLEIILSNQEKITTLLEAQNKLLDSILKNEKR